MLLKIDFLEVSRTCYDMYISKRMSVHLSSSEEPFSAVVFACFATTRVTMRFRAKNTGFSTGLYPV